MELDVRREGDVTASDVPAICGENPYQTRKSVLYKKALKLRSVDNPTTQHGHTFEPTALKRYCEKTGAIVLEYPCGYVKHPRYSWLGGTLDAMVRLPSGEEIVVEIKCPVTRQIIPGEVPVHYYGQVQTYLYIKEAAPFAEFVQYKPAGKRSPEKLDITRVMRDDNYMAMRLNSLHSFWEELQDWTGYIEKIVTVLQRSWRAYVLKKAADVAAKQCMMARLKCAKTVGKIAGFCRVRDARAAATNVYKISTTPEGNKRIFVDSREIVPYNQQPEGKRPRKANGSIFLTD